MRLLLSTTALLLASCAANSNAAQESTPRAPVAASTAAPTTNSPDTATTSPASSSVATTDVSQSPVEPSTHSTGQQPSDRSWPRPWDPAEPIDFSGVPGVTPQQQQLAERLAASTITELPAFSDPKTLESLGYFSIEDGPTGYEHFVNTTFLNDDAVLDPTRPESVVFRVTGNTKTLVSAMFMVNNTDVDDSKLAAIGGPLMQWHVHNDLCWEPKPGGFRVVGRHDPNQGCTRGAPGLTRVPMVHVWIVPHECGPFAALEGIGAGQVAGDDHQRTDQCQHGHGPGHDQGTPDTAMTGTATTEPHSRPRQSG